MKKLLTLSTVIAIILFSFSILFAANKDMEIRNAAGVKIGTIKTNGSIYDKNASKIGSIKSSTVRDKAGRKIGSFDTDGKLRDQAGRLLAKVDDKGNVRNSKGALVLKIKDNGDVRDKAGRKIASAKPFGANDNLKLAAYLCFFNRPDLFQ